MRWVARKARRLKYAIYEFLPRDHLPDIHEVNVSKPIRCNRGMDSQYKLSERELEQHYKQDPKESIWFGSFLNGKLLGYLCLMPVGGLAVYGRVLGHGKHLHDGIMPLLHYHVIRWLFDHCFQYCFYGSWNLQLTQLLDWKRRLLFEPIILKEEMFAEPDK